MKYILGVQLITVFSCTKNDNNIAYKNKELSVNNNSTSVSLIDEKKKYTEFVCVVNNCIGTKCDETKGNCVQHECEPVPGGCVSQSRLSDQEIEIYATEHARRMVQEGYIDQSDFNQSKELAKRLLRNIQ